MSYDFNTEILICGDCAVAALFKMPSNIQGKWMKTGHGKQACQRLELNGMDNGYLLISLFSRVYQAECRCAAFYLAY